MSFRIFIIDWHSNRIKWSIRRGWVSFSKGRLQSASVAFQCLNFTTSITLTSTHSLRDSLLGASRTHKTTSRLGSLFTICMRSLYAKAFQDGSSQSDWYRPIIPNRRMQCNALHARTATQEVPLIPFMVTWIEKANKLWQSPTLTSNRLITVLKCQAAKAIRIRITSNSPITTYNSSSIVANNKISLRIWYYRIAEVW